MELLKFVVSLDRLVEQALTMTLPWRGGFVQLVRQSDRLLSGTKALLDQDVIVAWPFSVQVILADYLPRIRLGLFFHVDTTLEGPRRYSKSFAGWMCKFG